MTPSVLRGLYLAAVTAYAVVVLVVSLTLPERAPLHFGPSGEPDSYGSRTQVVSMFVALGVVLVAILGLGVRAARRASATWLNLPAKDWWTATPERERAARLLVVGDLHLVGAATFLLLAAVAALVGRAASADAGLGAGIWVVLVAYCLAVAAWMVFSVRVRYRPTSG